MADEAIDHLINKNYDTENVKSTLNAIQRDASKQDQDLIPKLNSINESVQQSFSELLKTLNELKDEEEELKFSIDGDDSKLQVLENQVEEEMKENEKIKREVKILQQLKQCKEDDMEKNVKNFTNYLEELALSFEEAPKLYDDEVLVSEIAQLREKTDKVRENLAAMQTEILSMKHLLCNSNKDDNDDSLNSVKSITKNSGDADFMMSWLTQKNNGYIKNNEMLAKMIESNDFVSNSTSMI